MDMCSVCVEAQDLSPDMLSLAKLLTRMSLASYSTAFSGVDSPGTAFAMLRCACCHMFEEEPLAPFPRHLHAVAPYVSR